MCDRIILINKGKIILEGRPEQIKEKFNTNNLEEIFINITGVIHMTNSFFIIKELILADFKELSRNTKDIVWTIFVPLVLTLLLGLTFGADYMQFALPGLLAISIMFLCLFGLTVSIVWEREIKIYRRLRVTPIKLSQIITAKIVVFIILGLVQMSILMFIVGWFWGVSMKIHLYLLVSMLLTIFVFSTMGFVITAFSGDMQSGCNIVNILGFSMLYLGEPFSL